MHYQGLQLEKQRLVRERDKKVDAAIRRIQKERLEFDETSKAEAEEETRRLDEVGRFGRRQYVVVAFFCLNVSLTRRRTLL